MGAAPSAVGTPGMAGHGDTVRGRPLQGGCPQPCSTPPSRHRCRARVAPSMEPPPRLPRGGVPEGGEGRGGTVGPSCLGGLRDPQGGQDRRWPRTCPAPTHARACLAAPGMRLAALWAQLRGRGRPGALPTPRWLLPRLVNPASTQSTQSRCVLPARPPTPCGAGTAWGPLGTRPGDEPLPSPCAWGRGDLWAAPCGEQGRCGSQPSPGLASQQEALQKLVRHFGHLLPKPHPSLPACSQSRQRVGPGAASPWPHTPRVDAASPGDIGVPSLRVLRLRAAWGSVPLEQHLWHQGPRWGAWSCLLVARAVGDVPPPPC